MSKKRIAEQFAARRIAREKRDREKLSKFEAEIAALSARRRTQTQAKLDSLKADFAKAHQEALLGLKKRNSGSIGQRVRARSRSRQKSQKSVSQQTTLETDTIVKGESTNTMLLAWCLLAVLVVYYVERTKQGNGQ